MKPTINYNIKMLLKHNFYYPVDFYGKVKSIEVYKKHLSDRELIYLTGGNWWSYVKHLFKQMFNKQKPIVKQIKLSDLEKDIYLYDNISEFVNDGYMVFVGDKHIIKF